MNAVKMEKTSPPLLRRSSRIQETKINVKNEPIVKEINNVVSKAKGQKILPILSLSPINPVQNRNCIPAQMKSGDNFSKLPLISNEAFKAVLENLQKQVEKNGLSSKPLIPKENMASILEELNCVICFDLFDENVRKPMMLFPCGHTFCEACLKQINNNICPTCNCNYSQVSVNWSLKKMLSKPGGSLYKAKINEILAENTFKEFATTVGKQHEEHKIFVGKLRDTMNAKIEENQKKFNAELKSLDDFINSDYQANKTLNAELEKKMMIWISKMNSTINDDELKLLHNEIQSEFKSTKEKLASFEHNNINNIDLSGLDLNEAFLDKLAKQLSRFRQKSSSLEFNFHQLDLNKDPHEAITDSSIFLSLSIKFSFIRVILNKFYAKYKSKTFDRENEYVKRTVLLEINSFKNKIRKMHYQLNSLKSKDFATLNSKHLLLQMNSNLEVLNSQFNTVSDLCNPKEKQKFFKSSVGLVNSLGQLFDLLCTKNSVSNQVPEFDFNTGR